MRVVAPLASSPRAPPAQADWADGSALLLATQEWLTPNGRVIWHKGLAPDHVVSLPSDVTALVPEAERTMTPQQLRDSDDAQLLRGLEILSGG